MEGGGYQDLSGPTTKKNPEFLYVRLPKCGDEKKIKKYHGS